MRFPMSLTRCMKAAALLVFTFLACLCGASNSALAYSCSVSVTSLAFGNVDVLSGSAIASTAALSISCSGAPANALRMCININGGTASDSTSRQMSGPGSNQLRYQLFSDSTRTTPWGSWSANLYGGGFQWDVPNSSSNVNAATTVYAQVLASQPTIVPGSYASTLTVSMNYLDNTATPCPGAGQGAATNTFTTSATVVSNCTVGAATLNFGSAGVLTTNLDSGSSLNLLCSNTLPYTISLNGGNSGATDPTQRKMSSGANEVTYGIYRDSARTLPWGWTAGTDTVGGTGTGLSRAINAFGRVPAQTTPGPGTYQDTVVVTVTY